MVCCPLGCLQQFACVSQIMKQARVRKFPLTHGSQQCKCQSHLWLSQECSFSVQLLTVANSTKLSKVCAISLLFPICIATIAPEFPKDYKEIILLPGKCSKRKTQLQKQCWKASTCSLTSCKRKRKGMGMVKGCILTANMYVYVLTYRAFTQYLAVLHIILKIRWCQVKMWFRLHVKTFLCL